MADVNRGNRPLSPHLSIYRLPLSAITSIFVRITGNGLIVAAFMLVWWLAALASGPEAYARANSFMTSWFALIIWFFSVWALWYHLLGGVRHLIWDSGRMLDVETSDKFGIAMIVASAVLTLLTFFIA